MSEPVSDSADGINNTDVFRFELRAVFQTEKGTDEAKQDKKCSQRPCVPEMALGDNSYDRTCESQNDRRDRSTLCLVMPCQREGAYGPKDHCRVRA